MPKLLLSLLLAASALFAEWKTEPAGAPPSDLNPAIAGLLNKEGLKLIDGDKAVAEVWFRSSLPAATNSEANATLTNVAHGTLLGVVRVPQRWADRRGQQIKPGVYTLRYSLFPQDGAHQGVAPQRDFLLLLNAADDADPNKNLDYATVTKLSMKAGGAHPLVLSLWKADPSDFQAGISELGEQDRVLKTKIGDTPLAIIIYGRSEH